jgi:heme A synthase
MASRQSEFGLLKYAARSTPMEPRTRISRLAWFGAAYVYLLILFGAFVRLSGSGLGCGDDWPRCNGTFMPAWDFTTWVEWGHRLLGLGALLPFALVIGSIYVARERLGADRSLLTRISNWMIGLLIVQALLGALTVKLDLSAPVTAIHFVIANVLLALFLTIAVRVKRTPTAQGRRLARPALIAAGLALAAIFMGALTANGNAALACQGFPLCNGAVLPLGQTNEATLMLNTHWVHRLLAYGLFFYVLVAAFRAVRSRLPMTVKRLAVGAAALVTIQAAIGAGLVVLYLPMPLRSLHVVFGVALFATLVTWLLLARTADA